MNYSYADATDFDFIQKGDSWKPTPLAEEQPSNQEQVEGHEKALKKIVCFCICT
ncbi:UNVERIFIED_CONTAM: hypothetical protein FKN15_061502 [Acipenser sinensis]